MADPRKNTPKYKSYQEAKAAILNVPQEGVGVGDSAGPTFEDLFQEQLLKLLGPDPGATFRNVFSDVFKSLVDTPFGSFIKSQYQELQDAFVTAVRGAAEQGRPTTTFESFLKYVRPSLEKRYQFTLPGAAENFQGIRKLREAGGMAESPFERYIGNNFEDIFSQFQASAGTGTEGPRTFGEFLGQNKDRLQTEFQLKDPRFTGRSSLEDLIGLTRMQ